MAFSLAVQAQIFFTVTATAETAGGTVSRGYTPTQSYTFVYTLRGSFPENPDYETAGSSFWLEETISGYAQLFTGCRVQA